MSDPGYLAFYVMVILLFAISCLLSWRIGIVNKRVDILHKRLSMALDINGLANGWDNDTQLTRHQSETKT